MKLVLVSLLYIAVLACKENPKDIKNETEGPGRDTIVFVGVAPIINIKKIFEAHGGLKNWKSKRTLSFTIPKLNTPEIHTVDLYSRNEKIEMPALSMGSSGNEIWLLDEDEIYKGDPVFYHNLMFYFYAMPFVLADNGIMYSTTEPLEFEGTSYPGVRIGYSEGVGLSSKDEYFIHYNPETFQMEWLGYTVTFRSGEKSENIKWIRYNDWMSVDGVKLPKSITWHEYEGRTIKEARDLVNFENVTLSETALPIDFFSQPEGAKIMQ